jgi:hypothetical protein
MELEDVLLNIEQMAFDLGFAAPDVGTGKGKAYECWVMLELAVRLLRRGVTVLALNPESLPVNRFRIRGAPGEMPAHNEDWGATIEGGEELPVVDDRPSHFCFYKDESRKYELHLGLQCAGASGSPHEIDLCVLPQEAGEQLRHDGGGYYEERLELGLELKAYDIKHKLGHNIPRALIGVAVDLDPTWVVPDFQMRTVGGFRVPFTQAQRTLYGLFTTTRLFDHSSQYLDHHGVTAEGPVLPGEGDAILEEITDHLEQLL